MSTSFKSGIFASILTSATFIATTDALGRGHGSGHSQKEVEYHERMLALERQVEALIRRTIAMTKLAFGVDASSVQAPFGRFLLIRSNGRVIAIRIVEHTRPRQASTKWQGQTFQGSMYELYVIRDASLQLADTGEFNAEGSGPPMNSASADGIQLKWSVGDWFELDANMEVSRTESIHPGHVRVDDPQIQWLNAARLRRIVAGKEP